MKYVTESIKEIPVYAETDILVVGSGPAGLSAAIAAAREGVSTMLLERYGCFGGIITQVGVESYAWYRHEGKTIEAGGLAFEYEKRAVDMGAGTKESQSDSQAFDTELFKVVADRMVLEAGIKPLLHCYAVAAIIEDNVIKGVITESKSGRLAILAQRVIDCTGDADIAALAGAPFTKAPKDKLSSVSPMFHCRGVNVREFSKYIYDELKPTYKDWAKGWNVKTFGKEDDMFSPYLLEAFRKAVENGDIVNEPQVRLGGTYSTLTPEGEVTMLNVTFMDKYDCLDIEDLTKAEIKGRESVLNALTALKKYVPGFQNARLRNFSMTLGTRESRQIEGYYRLTGDDVMNEARFEDSIGIFPEFIDGTGMLAKPTTGRYFHVPYRVILPQKVENLLVAGRCISGDKMAHAAFRNMACCIVTGQGAGVAAALSVKGNVNASQVNIAKVQQALTNQGVRVF